MPYEQHSCSLMHKIIAREKSLYLIAQDNRLCGLFFLSQGGTLLPCLPHRSKDLAQFLQKFFKAKYIVCINGKADYVTFLNKLLTDTDDHELCDTRFYYLMEHEYSVKSSLQQPYTMEECSDSKADALFPLHFSYLLEEVKSPISQPDPVEERQVLKCILKSQYAIAVLKSGIPVSKAQTNAIGEHYVQIGGVYTQKQNRRQGFAGMLVSEIASWASKQGKKTVLFVNKYNTQAMHAYQNAGFTAVDNYIISYFV